MQMKYFIMKLLRLIALTDFRWVIYAPYDEIYIHLGLLLYLPNHLLTAIFIMIKELAILYQQSLINHMHFSLWNKCKCSVCYLLISLSVFGSHLFILGLVWAHFPPLAEFFSNITNRVARVLGLHFCSLVISETEECWPVTTIYQSTKNKCTRLEIYSLPPLHKIFSLPDKAFVIYLYKWVLDIFSLSHKQISTSSILICVYKNFLAMISLFHNRVQYNKLVLNFCHDFTLSLHPVTRQQSQIQQIGSQAYIANTATIYNWLARIASTHYAGCTS